MFQHLCRLNELILKISNIKENFQVEFNPDSRYLMSLITVEILNITNKIKKIRI